MSRLDAAEPVAVRVGDCLCANTPHDGQDGHDDGDIVYLSPQLSLEGGIAANAALRANDDPSAAERGLGLSFIRFGVVGWNFLDDSGKPIPATPENIVAALPWTRGGSEVAEKADELYSEALLRPLLLRAQKASDAGRTPTSISRTPKARTGTRRRSQPSLLASSA